MPESKLVMHVGPHPDLPRGSSWTVHWHRVDGTVRTIVRGKSTRCPFQRTQEGWLNYLKQKVRRSESFQLMGWLPIPWKDAKVEDAHLMGPANGLVVTIRRGCRDEQP